MTVPGAEIRLSS